MLEPMAGLGDGVLGFEAKGKVTGSDYDDVLLPAVESALEGGGRIRFLYLLGEAFDGYSPDAAWEDTKLGIHHGSDFERIALVSDHRAYRDAVALFGKAMRAQVRVFSVADLDEAREWIAR